MRESCVLGPKTGPERRAGYQTNFPPTTCRCGGQQLQAHHLCKHLVQAVEAAAPQPANFFEKLTR